MRVPPLLSIVTPCFNRREFVAEAIESVISQDYPYVEHVVVDGGSTDGTLEVLSRYPHLRVISEPDQGVYDALNKGLRMARGEVVGLLNTDDLYQVPGLSEMVDELDRHPEWSAVSGAADIFEVDPHGRKTTMANFPAVQYGDLVRRIALSAPIINAWLFRKSELERIGFFNRKYRIVGDSDLFIRARLGGLNFGPLDKTVYHYRSHKGSLTVSLDSSHWLPAAREIIQVSEGYLPRRYPRDVWFFCRIWHMYAVLFVFKSDLRQGKWAEALNVVLQSLRTNPLWPSLYVQSKLRGVPKSEQVVALGNV